MADTLYAWTKFTVPNADEPGNPTKAKTINPGDQISPADLSLEEDSADWQAYLDNGAVRPMQYPDTGNFPGSPVEYAKSQLAALAAEGGYYDSQYGRIFADTSVNLGPDGEPMPPEEAQVPAPQQEPVKKENGGQ